MIRNLIKARLTAVGALIATITIFGGSAYGQASYPPPNDVSNPYKTITNWAQLPDGRKWGSTAGVDIGPDGNIWTIDRCGANSCADSKLTSILEFDPSGTLLKQFGAGLFVFPHGMAVDKQGNVWITDALAKDGKGEQVTKLSPDGKVLLTLGKAGVYGTGPDVFGDPTDVAIAPNGNIFVADGHAPTCGASRIVIFSKDGKYLKEWGKKGTGPGELMCPHALAFDSKGRLVVGDRGNNQVSIYTQDGKFITSWKQFGRPSGLFIDRNDILYVTDSESRDDIAKSDGRLPEGYGYNPGCKRGIRIGSLKDGKVTAYIPDPAPTGGSSISEGVAADLQGNVYGAEVGPKDMKKYVKK